MPAPVRRRPAAALATVTSRRPRVSVVVTCFNYGRWLAGCVDSALGQPGVDVDVLIVDDASSDDSAAVAHALAARDPRVRVVVHARNRGHVPSVNEALGRVDGDYVVKLDADDLLTPDSLARSVALLEAEPEVGFVYGRALHFGIHAADGMSRLHRIVQARTVAVTDRPPARRIDARVRRWTVWPGATWLEAVCRRGANCISQPEVVMRAATLRAARGYDEGLPHTSDLAMWLRLALRADVGHVDGAIQGLYRVHPDGLQRTVHTGTLTDLRGRLAAFDSVLAGAAVPAAAALLDTARRRLAVEALEEACHAYDRGRAGAEPVEALAAFALDAWRGAGDLPEWRRLERRRRVGVRWAPWWPPFLFEALLRRLSAEWRTARWWRHGV